MSHERDSIYQAKQLVGPRDIRVLDIEPAEDFDETIRCSLRVISLDSNENSYKTLSYAWQSFENCKSIYCDGKSLTITSDLELALKRIREKMNSESTIVSTIWIDAICINQEDKVEKGHQVAMMGDIYAKSRRLIAWLGEANTEEIKNVRKAVQNPKAETSAEVLHAVTERPWFKRGWIIQEVFKSPRERRHALLGNYQLRLDTLILSYHAATGDWDAAPVFRGFRDNMLFKHASSPRPQGPGEALPCLLVNLVIFRDAKFSQAHDRIFALLSISSDRETITVDYEKDLRSLYLNVATSRVRLPSRLPVLMMLALILRNRGSVDLGLPTWVPDWRATNDLSQYESDELRNLFRSLFNAPRFAPDKDWGRPTVDEHQCLSFTCSVVDLKSLAACKECQQDIFTVVPWSRVLSKTVHIFCATEPVIFFAKSAIFRGISKAMELEAYLVVTPSRRLCLTRHSTGREVCIR